MNNSIRHRSAARFPAGALLLGMLITGRSFALDPAKSVFQFNCQNWSRRTGLPANKINTVVQTRDGYLWLGTQNGLVRFDGLEFKIIPIDLPQAQGQDVRKLFAARDGTLLFAINFGGFGRYGGNRFSAIGDARWSQPDMNANAILEARDGAIWTAADSAVGRWLTGNPAGSLFDETTTGIVISLCEDPAGRVWFGTAEHGLFYWADGAFVQFPDEVLKKRNIFALAADAENQIWVGTEIGLRCFSNGQAKAIPPFDSEVKALLVDRRGILWVGTTGMGLARYANGNFTYLKKADGLGSDNVTALFEDAEGSLWVGTQEGLSQVSDLKFPIYSSKEGIADGSCLSVAASQHGGLWITTDSGVSYLEGETIKQYTARSTLPNRYIKRAFEARNGDVFAIDGDKNIVVLSADRLLARFTNSIWPSAFAEDAESVLVGLGSRDPLFRIQSGKLTPYEYRGGSRPNFFWINNMCVARDGALWVASNNGIFRLKDGSFKQWATAEGLASLKIHWIFEDADGSMWTGSAAGLTRIQHEKVKNIRQEDGLGDERILAIIADELGYFWLASGRGILRIARQNLNDFADGKAPRVQCEVLDGLDAVKFNDQTGQEYSGCKTLDGRIWFPNPQGVVMIDPGHFVTNPIAPPVHIQQILADGTELKIGADAVLPGKANRVEIFFTALSYIAPRKVRIRYQLDGFGPEWTEAGEHRSVFYNKLPPGKYTFRVQAGNADGVWNTEGSSLRLQVPPAFFETAWFRVTAALAGLLLLFGAYRWKARHVAIGTRKLEAEKELLEAKVSKRTEELAGANTSLQREIEMHKETEFQLKQRTQSLETEIQERIEGQLEVERVHQELVAASRLAGMAEVATSVLHNVGNVLNSVNVASGCVADSIRKSKTANLSKVVVLLREHEANLGAFLTDDPRGKQLPGYLAQLADHLSTEQAGALTELAGLQKNIEHIKDIVTMQQSFARVPGATETLSVADLVEDALRMNASALARHDIAVTREFQEVPLVTVEKHKVLQILVNLVSNAKQACDESQRPDKQLTLRVFNGAGHVKVSVGDNGIGIPSENLARIFAHGFTTKQHGHGFGLHSGALAAKEMGGALSVHSDGPGQGATFILELPAAAPEDTHE